MKNFKYNFSNFLFISLLVTVFVGISATETKAQGEDKYIQFSGFVIDSKSEEALPGAYITIENAGRGVISNSRGYFILNVFPGDSIVFRYLGFSKQYHVIPSSAGLNYSAVVELQEDAKVLKEVRVYPFRTEEEFKDALIAMELPDERERQILRETFSQDNINRLVAMQAMSADGNYRFAMDQQLQQITSRGQMTMNPLFNVGAWANFIQTIKSGSLQEGLKDQSWKSKYENVPREPGSRDAIFRSGGN
ncbi:MAG: carboxypeptidase-like regulatory domain-containing protein [Spirosomaceae bacterium]|nr:carboxypeptidase-like regulatory domain-containing protein [Spirosomataceae bacterium]